MGRSAPHPVDEKDRLSPDFVEWMMGYPAGHTAGLTRAQRLKALGNAVVPNQAYYALNTLFGYLRTHGPESFSTEPVTHDPLGADKKQQSDEMEVSHDPA